MGTENIGVWNDALAVAEEELQRARKKLYDLQLQSGAREISDYTLKDGDGNGVLLSSLFGDKSDLIVVHNMGKGCPYCTLWADGFMGVADHLQNRAAFVVVSPDEPGVMKAFATGRGWTFPTLSNAGGTFTKDMGYENDQGKPQPGISTFHRGDDGKLRRVSTAPFGPGDDFCGIWHIFDMLQDGSNGWQPGYEY